MKTVFIAYANDTMAYSLKRIGCQARKTGVFNDVYLYTPDDIPQFVRESPLFPYHRGAGYWCWKPVIIEETLKKYEEGTVVVYVDAGCTLRKSSQWEQYFRLMERFDCICFQYDEYQPQWKKWGSESAKNKFWTKKATLDFAREKYPGLDVDNITQVLTGILFFKGKNNRLLKEWKEQMYAFPYLVSDPFGNELKEQYPGFAGHRHDQSLFTPLAILDPDTLVLPEISEKYHRDAFVWASRCRAGTFQEYLVWYVKSQARILFGDKAVELLNNRFRCRT